MHKILIELIITNQCNKRCEYCDLEFRDKSLSFQDIDLFIDFIIKNKAEYNINLFWGEPLLSYDKVQYFIDNSKENIKKISVWTNWYLLNKEKLDYFKKNKVTIYLSIDNINLWKGLDLNLISSYSEIIIINFINDPDFLHNSIDCFNIIKNIWFKNIAFMPVFSTKKWNISNLSNLKKIYNYMIKNSLGLNLEIFTYFNWVSVDKQFILDTDLYFYSDLDSLLWLQKQYRNTDNKLKQKIKTKTRLLYLKEKDICLNNLINLYNIKEIIKLVFDIPKKSGDYLTYMLIDKILKNGTKKRECIWM